MTIAELRAVIARTPCSSPQAKTLLIRADELERLLAVCEAAKTVAKNRHYGEWADQPSEEDLDALTDALRTLEDA